MTAQQPLRIPKDYVQIREVMTTFDNSIDYSVAAQPQNGKFYAQYSGWNFCGSVWWNEGRWACEVWVYLAYVKTVIDETLEGIMQQVSDTNGWE